MARYSKKELTKLYELLSGATDAQKREIKDKLVNARQNEVIYIPPEWLSPKVSMGDLIMAGLRVRFEPEEKPDMVNNDEKVDHPSHYDEKVDHPSHYGGKDNVYEAIRVIEAWQLGFHLGNTLKYIARAGKKGNKKEDLLKAKWYLEREIGNLQ